MTPATLNPETADHRRYPPRPLLGVGAVIFRDGKVLLIERGKEPLKGWWTLPGGLVETGERLECAVRREVREETGLEIRPITAAAIFERIMPDVEGHTEFHYVIIDYLCQWQSGVVQAGSDVAKAEWVALDRLDSVRMAPGTPPVIARALAMAAETAHA
jgi:ADP-ribose pyrophosphatase YjhB (NUDIX family)